MDNRRVWFTLAIAGILVAAVLRIFLIQVPLERDEAEYAYMGDRILAGEMPYVDAIDSKPPGIFLTFAAILAIGRSVSFIRIVLLLWTSGVALCFFFMAKRLYGQRTAGIATAILAISLTAPAYFGYALKTEHFMIGFIIAAFLILANNFETGSFRLDLAAGALLSVAVLYKPVAFTEGLPALALIAFAPGEIRKKGIRLLAVGFGFALVFVSVYGFFAAFGAGSDYWFWAFGYNFSYSSDFGLLDRVSTFVYQITKRGMLTRDWPTWLFAFVAIGASIKQNKQWALTLFPIFWLFSSIIGVSASGRYTPHYFIQLLPPLGLLCGQGVSFVLDKIEKVKAEKEFKQAFAYVLLGVILIYPTVSQAKLYLAGQQLSRILYGVNPFIEGELIGKYLADHTDPDDPIFVCGTEPQFLLHAKRKSATRFVALYPLGSLHPKAQQWQEQAFEEVIEADPPYIVMVHISSSMYLDMRAPKFLPQKTLELAGKNYVRDAALIAITARETEFITDDFSKLSKGPTVLTIFRKADKPATD